MTGQNNEAQWYIAREGKQHGPLTDVEMRTFVAHSYLRPADLIWRAGMPDWLPAPTVFPAVFQQPMPGQPQMPNPAPVSAPAQMTQSQMAQSQMAQQASSGMPSHSSDFESSGKTGASAKRSLGRQLALATVLIGVIGGGALALTMYREPLMKLLPGAVASAPAKNPAGQKQAELAKVPEAGKSTEPVTAPEPSAPATASSPAAFAAIDGSQVDARLQKIPVWGFIKKEYPDWYVTQITAAEKLVADKKSEADVAAQLALGLNALRRQNAEKALAASPEKLKRVATAFLENLKSLRGISVAACYGFISKGEASPAVVELLQKPEDATAFNSQAEAILQAAVEGGKTPSKHEPAVKGDYELLIKELSKLGWKDEDLQVFSNPRALAKREPEQVCQMVQDWFVAHLAIADPAAQERLLYETLKPVVQG